MVFFAVLLSVLLSQQLCIKCRAEPTELLIPGVKPLRPHFRNSSNPGNLRLSSACVDSSYLSCPRGFGWPNSNSYQCCSSSSQFFCPEDYPYCTQSPSIIPFCCVRNNPVLCLLGQDSWCCPNSAPICSTYEVGCYTGQCSCDGYTPTECYHLECGSTCSSCCGKYSAYGIGQARCVSKTAYGTQGYASVLATASCAVGSAPTMKPIAYPVPVANIGIPFYEPTTKPTRRPTPPPTPQPICTPTSGPTNNPTCKPTTKPTPQPSPQPTPMLTQRPTHTPTSKPTIKPTSEPTRQPSPQSTPPPTPRPTQRPTRTTTSEPTDTPTCKPIAKPTRKPRCVPTFAPVQNPTATPTSAPTRPPTGPPTSVALSPTSNPTTGQPTEEPTDITTEPSRHPTWQPTALKGDAIVGGGTDDGADGGVDDGSPGGPPASTLNPPPAPSSAGSHPSNKLSELELAFLVIGGISSIFGIMSFFWKCWKWVRKTVTAPDDLSTLTVI